MSGNYSYSISSAPLVLNGQNLGGGFNANFNLGGSVADYANAAYGFLNQTNSIDQAFLGQSINGSQKFLSSQLTPLTQAIANSQQSFQTFAKTYQQNFSNFIPSVNGVIGMSKDTLGLFANQMNTQFSRTPDYANAMRAGYAYSVQSTNGLLANALTAQQQLANQSFMTSQNIAANSGGGGGLCFVTTAICEAENKRDDCPDLMLLRDFRDNWMLQNGYKRAVALYYEIAPILVERINYSKKREWIYSQLRSAHLDNVIKSIKKGHYHAAVYQYIVMLYWINSVVS